MQHAPDVTLPRTAADAIALWDSGKPVPAFRVESEGANQNDIWAEAFDSLRDRIQPIGKLSLSVRETTVAREIAKAAAGHGYAKMVQNQLTGGGEPIFVTTLALPAVVDQANPGIAP